MAKINDYFDIEYGQKEYESKRDLKEKKDGTPLISSKGVNQGIYGIFDIEPKYTNVISVPRTGTICKAFYQGQPCCIDNNCLVLTPKKKLSLRQMFYFVFLIRKQKVRFIYGRQVTEDRLGTIEIPDKFPEWIEGGGDLNYAEIAKPAINGRVNLTDRRWRLFTYTDLFEIKKGKRIVVSKLTEIGDCPFVSSVDKNNGISQRLNIKPNHNKNTLTVNYDGSVGEAFYQPEDFWALDSVNVLYPRFNLNPYIAMFLIVMIKKERYRFNYYRKWSSEKMQETQIYLPIDDQGHPDWNFMEDFIKSLPYSKVIES